MSEKDIPVYLETNLDTLRALVQAVDLALKAWPGGDPQEQENLIRMRTELYALLMSVLFENELI